MFQNIHVTDWEKFSGHVSKSQTTKIDFKKLLFPAGQEEAWTSGLAAVAPCLQNVTQFEFQKVSAAAVENIGGSLTKNPYNKLTGESHIGYLLTINFNKRYVGWKAIGVPYLSYDVSLKKPLQTFFNIKPV